MTTAYDPRSPDIPGWMGVDELLWLHETAATVTSVVEVGSWMGRSTRALLTGCPGTVYAVDTFAGTPDERDGAHRVAVERGPGHVRAVFDGFVGHFPNLVVLPMDSVEAAAHIEHVDMVFLDGDHVLDAVTRDLDAWAGRCDLLCGHDYGWPGVNGALDARGIPVTNPVGAIWVRTEAPPDLRGRPVP